jgi:pyruvate kinase
MSELNELYQNAIQSIKNVSLLRRGEKIVPERYIVATHGPALTKALIENPELLNLIGIYRVNCSHIGKEPDLKSLAEYLRTLHPFVPILIDLQGPKPRIHETRPGTGGIPVKIGDRFEVTYESGESENRFCET